MVFFKTIIYTASLPSSTQKNSLTTRFNHVFKVLRSVLRRLKKPKNFSFDKI